MSPNTTSVNSSLPSNRTRPARGRARARSRRRGRTEHAGRRGREAPGAATAAARCTSTPYRRVHRPARTGHATALRPPAAPRTFPCGGYTSRSLAPIVALPASFVEPSTSVTRNVTAPDGRSAIDQPMDASASSIACSVSNLLPLPHIPCNVLAEQTHRDIDRPVAYSAVRVGASEMQVLEHGVCGTHQPHRCSSITIIGHDGRSRIERRCDHLEEQQLSGDLEAFPDAGTSLFRSAEHDVGVDHVAQLDGNAALVPPLPE